VSPDWREQFLFVTDKPLWYLARMRIAPPDAVDPEQLRRVLVIKLRHHGDVLLASPVFTALKGVAPAAEIDALVYEETAPMLGGHPAISRVHLIDRGWKRRGLVTQARAEVRLLRELAARHYDLVVHLTEHPRGAWLTRILRPRYAVARELPRPHWLWRTSFTHYYRLPRARPRHTVECNLDALRRLGFQPSSAERKLVLVPAAMEAERAAALIARQGLGSKRFVQLHPGSRWMFKCWTAEGYAGLIERLADEGWKIAITGAPDQRERELIDAILVALSAAGRAAVVDLTGTLSLRELAALTREARLFVGVDSAPMHIAAAVSTPVVALFGPSGEFEWGPWQVAHRVLTSERHPCRPCGIDGCGGGKLSECLATLSVERVHAAVRELLAETQAGPAP
jgi:heptosyltransferase-3